MSNMIQAKVLPWQQWSQYVQELEGKPAPTEHVPIVAKVREINELPATAKTDLFVGGILIAVGAPVGALVIGLMAHYQVGPPLLPGAVKLGFLGYGLLLGSGPILTAVGIGFIVKGVKAQRQYRQEVAKFNDGTTAEELLKEGADRKAAADAESAKKAAEEAAEAAAWGKAREKMAQLDAQVIAISQEAASRYRNAVSAAAGVEAEGSGLAAQVGAEGSDGDADISDAATAGAEGDDVLDPQRFSACEET